MNPPRCQMCGDPASPTPLGSLFCPGCRVRYREYRCRRCGQLVIHSAEVAADPGHSAGICGSCRMRERAAALAPADREAIRAAAERRWLNGVKEARDRLGWSIPESVQLVDALCDGA